MIINRSFRSPATPSILADRRGAAALEMALSLPILLTLIFGILTYGGWFFTAHNVQLAANEAARAAISGLNPAERAQIAQSSVDMNLRRSGTLDSRRASVLVDDNGDTLVVRIDYDASNDPLLSIHFLPLPSTTIERSAAVKLGGA